MLPGIAALAVLAAGATVTFAATAGTATHTLEVWGSSYGFTPNTVAEGNTSAWLNGVTAISFGYEYGVAVKADGTVRAWGRQNESGQLGNGTTRASSSAVTVSGLQGVTAVAAGYRTSLALRNDGTVWAWGGNGEGLLGDGQISDDEPYRSTPGQVPGLDGVIAIAQGGSHALAVKQDGTVWGWGWNEFGEIGGPDTLVNVLVPRKIEGLAGIVAVAAGPFKTVAVKGDGTVWTLGDNSFGDLGNGTIDGPMSAAHTTPAQVSGLRDVKAVAVGGNHVDVALKQDGTVWTWGTNTGGVLGNGSTVPYSTVPVQVSTADHGLPHGAAAIAAADRFIIALKPDGTVYWWGCGNGCVSQPATFRYTSGTETRILKGMGVIAAGPNSVDAGGVTSS